MERRKLWGERAPKLDLQHGTFSSQPRSPNLSIHIFTITVHHTASYSKMAQGAPKKAKAPAPKTNTRVQTGNRVIKPKNAALVKQQQMKKKHSSGLTALTEKSLASKAGHLEMLSGWKKDRKKEVAKEAARKTKS